MSVGAQLYINATVTGYEQLERLQEQIYNLTTTIRDQNLVSQLAEAQQQKEIVTLRLSNAILDEKISYGEEYIKQLAEETVVHQDLQAVYQEELQSYMDAFRVKQLYMEQGRAISEDYAMYLGKMYRQSIADAQAAAAATKEAEASQRLYRRELMQSSISMFVLNISASQMLQSLKPLVAGNEAATKAIDTMIASLRLALTPMQTYLAMLQIIQAAQGRTTLTAIQMGAAMSAAFFWIIAIQQQNEGIRAALFGLAGALTVVAIASWGAATGIGVFETLLGNVGALAALAIGVGTLAAAVGYITTPPKAQTLTNQMKYVRGGGLAQLDPGEVVMRPSADGLGGGDTYYINLPSGMDISFDSGRAFAKGMARELDRGATRSTVRRMSPG